LRRTRRALALRHPHQAAARENVERPLAESTQTSYGPTASGNDDLASTLDSLQVLAETVVQLADADFILRLM
jgi:hypothetical protein